MFSNSVVVSYTYDQEGKNRTAWKSPETNKKKKIKIKILDGKKYKYNILLLQAIVIFINARYNVRAVSDTNILSYVHIVLYIACVCVCVCFRKLCTMYQHLYRI